MNSKLIREIPAENAVEWNAVVKKIKAYDVFYLNEYVSAFQEENEENGTPVLIVYENGNEMAINVVFRRDIAKSEHFKEKIEPEKYYDLISPYGYGGFIGNITDYIALNRSYDNYCAERGYVSEFIRFELFGDYYKYYQGEVESRTHNVVRDLSMPLEEIWMDFKQKVRKNVKKAVNSGLEIIQDASGRYLDDFLAIYYGTMKRNQANDSFYFSKNFFETINRMEGNYIYFHVLYDNKIISTELVIYGAENCYSYLGGTDSDFFALRPNDFLKYEIIKWAKEKGLKHFVLGGGYGADDGIFQYKTCLAPKGIVDFHIGRRIFDVNRYEWLLQIREKETDAKFVSESFFPKYRG